MVETAGTEDTKKRKKDYIDSTENNHTRDASTDEASPRKNLKMVHSIDGSSHEVTQESESDNSQLNGNSTQDTVSRDEAEQSSHQSSCTQKQKSDPEIQDFLKLDEKHVFTRLLIAFSQEKLPDKIKFNGSHFNLTAAYNEFWKTFYNSTYYSEGREVKIPKVENLIDLEVKSLVNILKRGWEDERFWPKELSHPFLASCLFENFDVNSTKPEVFLKFIDAADELLFQDKNTVDENTIEIFKKYCSASEISIGDDINNSCIKAANEIIVSKMKPIIDIWREELSGLMPMSTFDYLMNPIPKSYFEGPWDDLENFTPPHELWQTFLLDWPEEKVKFYAHSLTNGAYGSNCNLCKETHLNAKHFLCACDSLLDTLRRERHEAVGKKLLSQLDSAKKKNGLYFGKGRDWKVLTLFNNEEYNWPEEMSILSGYGRPHIVVYSLSPEKRALVIVHSISWEHWLGTEKEKKAKRYLAIKEKLEEVGFEVEYRVFDLGSRGVLSPDLYNLFEEIFGMKHSEISKAHEEISREIISYPYHSKYYEDLKTFLNK